MALVALINLYKRQKLQLGLFQPDVQIALIALISTTTVTPKCLECLLLGEWLTAQHHYRTESLWHAFR